MKFTVTMKDPDTLSDSIREAVKLEVDKLTGLFETERDGILEERTERITKGCAKWFQHGEYLTVEIDTDAGACAVVPRAQPATPEAEEAMTAKVDTKAVRARADAATAGPWRAETDSFNPDDPEIEACVTNITADLAAHDLLFTSSTGLKCARENWAIAEATQEMLDARFIAAARTDVPALCDELDERRANPLLCVTGEGCTSCEPCQQRAHLAKARAEVRTLRQELDRLTSFVEAEYCDEAVPVSVALALKSARDVMDRTGRP